LSALANGTPSAATWADLTIGGCVPCCSVHKARIVPLPAPSTGALWRDGVIERTSVAAICASFSTSRVRTRPRETCDS
jgi:hypothetical protein